MLYSDHVTSVTKTFRRLGQAILGYKGGRDIIFSKFFTFLICQIIPIFLTDIGD